MLDDKEFSDALSVIYEAAAIPETWSEAISRIAGLAGCAGGLIFSQVGSEVRWISCEATAPLMERFIREGWMDRNDRAQGLLSNKVAGFVSDYDVFSPQQLQVMPVYTEFLRPLGFGWGAATQFRAASGETIIVSLERRYADGPVSRSEIERLDRLRPHLARSAVLASRLRLQRAKEGLSLLQSAGVAAALVGAGGKLMATNAGFEALQGQIAMRSFDRLALKDKAANALLQRALTDLAGDTEAQASSVPVPRRNDAPAFVVHVTPLRRSARDLFISAEVLLVVSTTDRAMRMEPNLLCELYDLTRAEAAVAGLLLEGLSLREIAARNAVSFETVRAHTKKVLAKTGSRSQGDFIRRLAPVAL